MTANKILIGILVVLMSSELAGAVTLNVGPGQTYATIQSAIDAANTGDVISVNEGTYVENVHVKKNGIWVIGKNKEKTIIDGQKVGSVLRIEANNAVVSGFTIRNNGGSGKDDAGISLYKANNNLIANSIIENNTVGIAVYSSSNNNTISGNYISSNGRYGIFVYSSDDNKIYNNNLQNNQIGIYGDAARTSRIYSNNFIDNKDQAYDNSGKNSWDEEKSGNYWSNYKGSGAYNLLGGAKAADNYPLSGVTAIKEEAINLPSGVPGAQGNGEGTGKSSPAFVGLAVLAVFIAIGALRNRKRGTTG